MTVRTFGAPDGEDPDAFAARVAALLGAEVHAPRKLHRTWLDTFDARLRRAGVHLWVETGADGAVARRLHDDGPEGPPTPVSSLPRRPEDLPEGELRDALAPIVGNRALLPRVTERVRRVATEVRDASGRVALRADVERVDVPQAPKARRRVGLRVRLWPVHGATDAFERAEAALRGAGLAEVTATPLDEALAAAGLDPLPPGARPEVPLDPSERADDALCAVLRALLGVIEANTPGVVDDVDPEFLHDLRVAVRRTRSLLRQVRGVLPKGRARRFADAFRELQQVTGFLRDLDVQLEAWPSYRERLDPALRPALEPLRDRLRAARAEEHARAASWLGSRRWRRTLRAYAALLDTPAPGGAKRPRAALPVAEVARADVSRLYRAVLDQGRALDVASPAEALHELRKTCKKLRYLLEAFRPVLPVDAVDRAVGHLKALQKHLGAFQDQEVHAATLTAFGEALAAEGVGADTLVAVGTLVGELRADQAGTRRRVREAFADFDRRKVARAFAAIAGPPD